MASLNMHVSKPPKEDSHAGKFLAALKSLTEQAKAANRSSPIDRVGLVHKKINLADERLAWEHERFSIRKVPAFTLSTANNYQNRQPTVMDTSVNADLISTNIKLISEALACVLYEYDASACQGNMFGSLAGGDASAKVSSANVAKWTEYLSKSPRFASLLTSSKANNDPQNKVVSTMFEALKTYTHAIRVLNHRRDKREPEFNFYDLAQTTMSAHRVKPAVFDLLLSLVIGGYLCAIYGLITKSNTIVSKISKLISPAPSSKSSSNGTNGHHEHSGKLNGNGRHFSMVDSPRLKAH